MRLQGVAAEHIDRAWPLLETYIRRATDQSPHFLPEDIRQACKARDMSLWALMDGNEIVGCLVAQVAIYPRVKAARIVLAAADDGKREEWLPLFSEIKEWARSYGCEILEASGREGWGRLFPAARRYAVLEWEV